MRVRRVSNASMIIVATKKVLIKGSMSSFISLKVPLHKLNQVMAPSIRTFRIMSWPIETVKITSEYRKKIMIRIRFQIQRVRCPPMMNHINQNKKELMDIMNANLKMKVL